MTKFFWGSVALVAVILIETGAIFFAIEVVGVASPVQVERVTMQEVSRVKTY